MRTSFSLKVLLPLEVKEARVDGRAECCRYEPSLEELLDDDVMTPVLRSAGFDPQRFRDMIAETARRVDDRRLAHAAADAPLRDRND
jgi:hypothetical protein